MTGTLDGRVAIVTGGGLGIGRAHVLELAREGAAVVIADPGMLLDGTAAGSSPAEDVVAEVRAAGGVASAVSVSVTDFDGVEALVRDVVAEYGRLDIVVNNAGITRDRLTVAMEEGDWDAVIAVHLKGTFALTRHAGAHWRSVSKQGGIPYGRIINTSSGAGMRGNVGQAAYSAAKAGIAALTVTSAMELARYGVTVNAISPVARTRMTEAVDGFLAAAPSEGFDPFAPENSSPVVAYLATEKASWISGQVIRIDGGQLRYYERWQISQQAFAPLEPRRLEVHDLDVALKSLYGVLPLGLGDQRLARNA